MSEGLPLKPAHVREDGIKTTTGGSHSTSVARADRAPPRWVVLDGERVVGIAGNEEQAQELAKRLGGSTEKVGGFSLPLLAAGVLLTMTVLFSFVGVPLIAWALYSANTRRKRLETEALALLAAQPAPLSGRAAELMDQAARLLQALPGADLPDIARSDLEDSLEDIQSDLRGLHATEARAASVQVISAELEERRASVQRAFDSLAGALDSIEEALGAGSVELSTDLGAVAVKAQAARNLAKRLQ